MTKLIWVDTELRLSSINLKKERERKVGRGRSKEQREVKKKGEEGGERGRRGRKWERGRRGVKWKQESADSKLLVDVFQLVRVDA